jgi:hypothetical protein
MTESLAQPAVPAVPPDVPAEKQRRKGQGRKESAGSYHSTDSTGISLAAVDSKYHQRLLEVLDCPKAFNGQLVMLVDSTLNPLPGAWTPGKLRNASRIGFLTCFAQDRQKEGRRLYVIIYLRVSSRGQALKGTALEATLRFMLKKCERHGLSVAGVAVDIESGREEDRVALGKVMEVVQSGQVSSIVVPAISRLERNEAHFGMRMQTLAGVESWVYYGQTYEDPYFDYCAWHDWDSRDRAVTQVRAAEKYVQDGMDGVTSTDRSKLQDGYLISVNKRDTFCIYDIHVEDEKRKGAFRKIIRTASSKATYNELKASIMEAASRSDETALVAIAKAQAERTGKDLDVEDLWWELAIGWVIAKNQRSPINDEGLSAECEELRVEDDVDSYWELMKAFAHLKGLSRRQRAKQVLASDALSRVAKQKIAEAQAERDDAIQYRLSCNCTEPPTPVRCVGNGPKGSDVPQDWVVCPSCGRKQSGSPDKRLLPEKRDYRRAMAAPDEPCHKCRRYLPLVEETVIRVDDLQFKVYRCANCAPGLQVGRTQVLLAPLPEKAAPKPKGQRRLAMAKQPWDGIQRPRLEAPKEAPSGAPPLYTGSVPSGNPLSADALKPSKVADRLEAFVDANPGRSFTTDQLRAVAVGGVVLPGMDPILTKRWNRGQKFLKDRLAGKGKLLRSIKRSGEMKGQPTQRPDSAN